MKAPDLRYPIGRFEAVNTLTSAQRSACIAQIAAAPAELRRAVAGLDDRQLDTPYRPEGWTVRQVVHHVPDSHMNAYTRFKLACTEATPAIKTYDEKRWAELPEARTAPIEMSLALLESLHRRWELFLQSLGPGDFARTVKHPDWGTPTVDFLLAQYAWHGRHHTAHITSLRERMGW
ncbi:MAG TPA: putative metal-dependent hydrolase [Gemmatimonadales bacterium]|nr:putative metal-dependent hydrolase [Gemmatimonadales bacterium]